MKTAPRALYPQAPRGAAAAGVFSTAPAANKYRAKAVVTEEGRFASKKEHADWCYLKQQERAGIITRLERQVKFDLTCNGQKICSFTADAIYFRNGQRVVVDSKGVKTPVYRLKKKLMKVLLNIEVIEI